MHKIFGREPAVVLALIASVIMMFATFIHPLSVDQQGGLNAVAMGAVGIFTMWAVAEDGGLALIVGLCKAIIALGISFGLHWAPETQAVVMTFVTVTAQAFIVRPNVIAPVRADGLPANGKKIT